MRRPSARSVVRTEPGLAGREVEPALRPLQHIATECANGVAGGRDHLRAHLVAAAEHVELEGHGIAEAVRTRVDEAVHRLAPLAVHLERGPEEREHRPDEADLVEQAARHGIASELDRAERPATLPVGPLQRDVGERCLQRAHAESPVHELHDELVAVLQLCAWAVEGRTAVRNGRTSRRRRRVIVETLEGGWCTTPSRVARSLSCRSMGPQP